MPDASTEVAALFCRQLEVPAENCVLTQHMLYVVQALDPSLDLSGGHFFWGSSEVGPHSYSLGADLSRINSDCYGKTLRADTWASIETCRQGIQKSQPNVMSLEKWVSLLAKVHFLLRTAPKGGYERVLKHIIRATGTRAKIGQALDFWGYPDDPAPKSRWEILLSNNDLLV